MVSESERKQFSHLFAKNADSLAMDVGFREKAITLLHNQGISPVKLLLSNPLVSIVELARLVNSGINAIGLEMAILADGEASNCLRDVAMELILRHIRELLPAGLDSQNRAALCVPLAFWKQGLKRQVKDESVHQRAAKVSHCLAHDTIYPNNWLPVSVNDASIRTAFDEGWPT